MAYLFRAMHVHRYLMMRAVARVQIGMRVLELGGPAGAEVRFATFNFA